MATNSDFVETVSMAENPKCPTCSMPMRTLVHMPTKRAFSWCPFHSTRDEMMVFKLKFKDLMNVNDDGYKDARSQYKQEWAKL